MIAVEEVYAPPLVDTLPVTSVLDVGTGTGRHALRWARRGATVTALDQSPEMLVVAKQTAHAEGLPITFIQATLSEHLPLASGQFDLVICKATLNLQSCTRLALVGMADDVSGGFVRGEDDGLDYGLTDAAAPADAFDKRAHEAELPAITGNG